MDRAEKVAGLAGGESWTVTYGVQAWLPVLAAHQFSRLVTPALSPPSEIDGGSFGKGKL